MAKLLNINKKSNGGKTLYADEKSVENLCKYVVGEDGGHSSQEILGRGEFGVMKSETTQAMATQMLIVQNDYKINQRGGRRMAHMCNCISEEEFGKIGCNENILMNYFDDCARDFYEMGHQVVYGVHLNNHAEEEGTHAFAHVHFAINSINFNDGKKFHMNRREVYEEENVMNQQLEEYQNQSAVIFKNADVWRRGQDDAPMRS